MVPYPYGYVKRTGRSGWYPGYISEIMTERNLTEQAQTRLRRIEGQVRGIQRMLDCLGESQEGEPCDGLLTQVLAVRSAVEQVGLIILELHLQQCAMGDKPLEEEQLSGVRDALKLWARLT